VFWVRAKKLGHAVNDVPRSRRDIDEVCPNGCNDLPGEVLFPAAVGKSAENITKQIVAFSDSTEDIICLSVKFCCIQFNCIGHLPMLS
jgi:hypothetical protein